jgi:ankyrin repeat protein
MPFLSLPTEIILLVSNQLRSNQDFLELLLVNHLLHDLLIGQLYRRDICDTGGLALLFYANWGYDSAARHMLAAGVPADIRGPPWDTRTALLLAISRHHTAIVKDLLDYGADPNFRDNIKHGPLETAILNDCGEDIIEMLLDYGADINLKGYSGRTPLFTAVIASKSVRVPLLLARGANVHARESKERRTPLHFAAEQDTSFEIVNMLLDAGSDVNCLTENGLSPLHKAAFTRAANTIRILLERGADVNLRTSTGYHCGQTALHHAIRGWGKFKAAINLLITHGADVNSRDSQQRTPLLLNVEQNSSQCQEIAELLLYLGADICARDERG